MNEENTPPNNDPASGIRHPASAPETPAAPPAAKIVATGQRSEREIALERERDAAVTDAERMKAERDTEKTARKPAAKPAPKKKGGWTFFHEKAEGAD